MGNMLKCVTDERLTALKAEAARLSSRPGLDPSIAYYVNIRCVYFLPDSAGDAWPTPTGIANSDGSVTFDSTYPGGAGQTVQFDGSSAHDWASATTRGPTSKIMVTSPTVRAQRG
jgi:hypothetical protein